MSKPVESVVTQPVYIHDVRKEQQDWLREARRFCRCVGIGVSGWGADTLIVEAKSPDHTKQISSQLRRFGWSPIENEDDAGAGLLLLSRNSAATRPNKSSSTYEKDVLRDNTRLGNGASCALYQGKQTTRRSHLNLEASACSR